MEKMMRNAPEKPFARYRRLLHSLVLSAFLLQEQYSSVNGFISDRETMDRQPRTFSPNPANPYPTASKTCARINSYHPTIKRVDSLFKALSERNSISNTEDESILEKSSPKLSSISPREKKKRLSSENENYNFWEDTFTVASFNMDLENLAQEDPQKAADALEIMEHMYLNDPENDYYVKPNVACYTTVIDGWVQFQSLPSSSILAPSTKIKEDIEDIDNNHVSGDNTPHQPSRHTYNDQNNNNHHYGAQQAQAWLDRLEARYEATGDADLKPNAVTYMLVCQKWANDYAQDFTGESAEKAELILEKMRERLGDTASSDDVKVWTIVLEGWCRRAGKIRGAIYRAEKILTEMEQRSKEQSKSDGGAKSGSMGSSIRPNIVTYTSFIGGLARSKERNTANKAEEVLVRMKSMGIEPDMVAYTAVLNCYSKASSREERSKAAKRALEILDLMETRYTQNQMYHLRPNLITYSTAIKAIGNSLDDRSAELAEKVLKRMYSLHEAGTIANIKPQTSTYNAVISALAAHSRRIRQQFSPSQKSGFRPKTSNTGVTNARRAEQLLVEMTRRARDGDHTVEPNVRTWGAVISAWAESGQEDAGEQCRRVLDSMEKLVEKGQSEVRPNFVCYTTAMAASGNSALANTSEEAIARNIEAADSVEEMLIKMENDYEETMDEDKRPNTITYISAIESFCKLDEARAAERSQATIDRMIRLYAKGLGHVRPSRIVFNSLINAWSRSPNPNAAQKAEEIFKWMEQQYRDAGDYVVKPDEVSLCGVLNAWANNAQNGGARRAQQILDHMESMSQQERGFQHTTICYNIVIKAWGRSRERDAVQKAERVLTRLEEQENLKPDVTTYSSVINCCAYYSGAFGSKNDAMPDNTSDLAFQGRQEAFDVALRTFQKMCASKNARPNNITYGTLFKAIANLTPVDGERERIVRSLFDQCCKEGQVDGFVLSQVRVASPNSLYRELVLEPSGSGTTDYYFDSINAILKKMPARWGRNIRR